MSLDGSTLKSEEILLETCQTCSTTEWSEKLNGKYQLNCKKLKFRWKLSRFWATHGNKLIFIKKNSETWSKLVHNIFPLHYLSSNWMLWFFLLRCKGEKLGWALQYWHVINIWKWIVEQIVSKQRPKNVKHGLKTWLLFFLLVVRWELLHFIQYVMVCEKTMFDLFFVFF